jgi:hypothetical protein
LIAIPRWSALLRRSDARERDLGRQAIRMSRIFDSFRHLMAFCAFQRSAPCAARNMRAMRAHADSFHGRISPSIERGRWVICFAVTLGAGISGVLHTPIDVQRGSDDATLCVNHLRVAHRAAFRLWVRR